MNKKYAELLEQILRNNEKLSEFNDCIEHFLMEMVAVINGVKFIDLKDYC